MSIWYWAAITLILGIVELVTGTVYLLWLGVSALLTLLITFIFPEISLNIQAALFAMLGIVGTSLWFIRNKKQSAQKKTAPLNEKAAVLVGRKITLQKNMQDYQGQVMVDGVLWRIKASENYTSGTVVQIKDVDATVLIVNVV